MTTEHPSLKTHRMDVHPTAARRRRPSLPVSLLLILTAALGGCSALQKKDAGEAQSAAVNAAAYEQLVARGDADYQHGDMEKALVDYSSALSVAPKADAELLFKIGSAHEALGDATLATRSYRAAIKEDGQNAGYREALGLILARQANYDEARTLLTDVVTRDAKRWRSWNALGVIADYQSQYDVARTNYLKALEAKPEDPMLLSNLGFSRYTAGDLDEAEKRYEQALAVDPNRAKTWSNLGLLHVRKGEYDKAIEAFRRVMDEGDASTKVGYFCMMEGRYDDAEKYFAEAIRLSPTYNVEANSYLEELRKKAMLKAGVGTSMEMQCK